MNTTPDTATTTASDAAPSAMLASLSQLAAPRPAELMTPAAMYLESARLMPVTTVEEYGFAADELREIKSRQDRHEKLRTSITGPLNGVLKSINALFKPAAEALSEAELIIKAKMLAFDQAQQAAAAKARAEAEARAQAERERLAREAAAAEAAATAQLQALQQQAQQAQAAGDEAAAAAAQQQAAAVQAQAATNAAIATATATAIESAAAAVEIAPKAAVKGVTRRSKWVASVHDKAALLAHIAQNPSLLALVEINQSALNKLADAQREGFSLPGCSASQEFSLAAAKK